MDSRNLVSVKRSGNLRVAPKQEEKMGTKRGGELGDVESRLSREASLAKWDWRTWTCRDQLVARSVTNWPLLHLRIATK